MLAPPVPAAFFERTSASVCPTHNSIDASLHKALDPTHGSPSEITSLLRNRHQYRRSIKEVPCETIAAVDPNTAIRLRVADRPSCSPILGEQRTWPCRNATSQMLSGEGVRSCVVAKATTPAAGMEGGANMQWLELSSCCILKQHQLFRMSNLD